MGKVISQEQLAFYQRKQYVLLRNILNDEVLDLAKSILNRWMTETIQQWVDEGLLPDSMQHIAFERRLVDAWNAAGRPKYIRSPRRDLVSKETYDFLRHEIFLDISEDLLGTPEVSVHGVFNARPKLPDQRWTDTPWHQDAQYYRDAEHFHVVSMWVPLQRVTEENSCLEVAPGFFTNRVADGVVDEYSGFLGLKKEDAAQLNGIPIEMEPGDVLCFSQLLPHRALPNRSDAVRWSMDIRFEATPNATESGKAQGFVARSKVDPSTITPYEVWLEKWGTIPKGNY